MELQGAMARTTGTARPVLWKFSTPLLAVAPSKLRIFILLEQINLELALERERTVKIFRLFPTLLSKPSGTAARIRDCGKIQSCPTSYDLKMAAAQTKKISLTVAAIAVVLAATFVIVNFSRKGPGSARAELLGFVPADATSVIFIDVDQLRSSPFLATLYAWASHPAEDSEYKQFIADTGFNYERDLSQVFMAVSNRGNASGTVVLAEGKFDRQKIEAHLSRNSPPTRQGNFAIFRLPPEVGAKPAFLAFLSDHRVAITDSENLPQILSAAVPAPVRGEWQTRFDRLAGSPLFAVIRQDPTVQNVVANQSPQLATFIGQLPWITLAARPDGNLLRVVVEGETITDAASTQLRDFLQGILLLAETGLNSPKLRQQMDPEERAAYIELFKGTEIERVTRGDSKSVRIVVPITERFLRIAKLPAAAVRPAPAADRPQAANSQKRSPQQAKPTKK
jgi:hypothetical protein